MYKPKKKNHKKGLLGPQNILKKFCQKQIIKS